jgi:hypothetical protein
VEASASGLLHTLQIDPFSRKDVIQLRQVLDRLNTERYKFAAQNELLISVAMQICMAVGNRKAYDRVSETTFQIRDSLRGYIFPEQHAENAVSPKNSEYVEMMQLWERIFGNAEDADRKLYAREKRKEYEQESGLVHTVDQIVSKSLFKR